MSTVSIEPASPDTPGGMPTASRAEATVTDSTAREDDSVAAIASPVASRAMGEIGGSAPEVKATKDGRIAELHRQMWSDAERCHRSCLSSLVAQ